MTNGKIEVDDLLHRCARNKMVVRPPSLSSSDEDEVTARHRKSFEEVFVCMRRFSRLIATCSSVIIQHAALPY
jgi:hypothetical protein